MKVNRQAEETANHFYYNLTHFDKRNRFTHNLIMEHFEMHKESLEDLISDLDRHGPAILSEIPERPRDNIFTYHDLELLDELSGMKLHYEKIYNTETKTVSQEERVKAYIEEYSGDKDRQMAINELSFKIYGDNR